MGNSTITFSWCSKSDLMLYPHPEPGRQSVMKQFDLLKAKAGEALTTAAQALSTLAGDIETEESEMGGDMAQDSDDNDDEDGLADVHDGMSDEEIAELDKTLQPVKLMLVKVSSVCDLKAFFI